MTEYIRDVSVTIKVDTNKQTYESTFESLPSALAWLDKVAGQGPLDVVDYDRLLIDVEGKICEQRPSGASADLNYVDNSLTGTVEAVLCALREQLAEKDV